VSYVVIELPARPSTAHTINLISLTSRVMKAFATLVNVGVGFFEERRQKGSQALESQRAVHVFPLVGPFDILDRHHSALISALFPAPGTSQQGTSELPPSSTPYVPVNSEEAQATKAARYARLRERRAALRAKASEPETEIEKELPHPPRLQLRTPEM
jgi:hypothetical protein